jgi:hypothetical protein
MVDIEDIRVPLSVATPKLYKNALSVQINREASSKLTMLPPQIIKDQNMPFEKLKFN